MRLVNTNYLQEGAVLARSIVNSRGKILLRTGVKLTQSYIQHLQRLGFSVVFICDERLEDVEVHETLRTETRELAYKTIASISESLETNNPRDLPVEKVRDTILTMIDDLLYSKDILNNLLEIQGFDQDTFSHSINTTSIALSLGIANKYTESELLILGMGVIMHDVGKLKIPEHILKSSKRLTKEEFEIIKKHSVTGFDILRQNKDLSILCSHVALQHHEKWDGTGYPRGLRQNEIHKYSRIAAVSDVYEALTSWRVYRKPLEPYQAYEYIISQSESHFDPKIVNVFSKRMVIYPNGSGVTLSNGEKGFVIRQNQGFPSRPHVRIFYQDNDALSSPIEYNLLEHPSLMISKVENI